MKHQGISPIWQKEDEGKESDDEAAEGSEQPDEEVKDETEASEDEATETVDQEEQSPASYESFADRLPNVKKVRNTRLIRRLSLIVTIAVIAILILVYFISPLSTLGGIKVVGNENTDTQAVIDDSKLKQGASLWEQYWNRAAYEKNVVKSLPRVKKAVLSLDGLNTFKISIEEYQVMALDAKDGIYHPILENGKVLPDRLEAPVGGMPIFENFEDESVIKSMMEAYNKLPNDLKEQISEIKYAPSDSNKELLNLYMKDSNQVIVNISQLAEKMNYYTQVASQMTEQGVIDMEVGIFSYSYGNEEKNKETDESSVDSTSSEAEGV